MEIEMIEPDRDLIEWSRQYRKAINHGVSLDVVRREEAFPLGVKLIDPYSCEPLARRWIHGGWRE